MQRLLLNSLDNGNVVLPRRIWGSDGPNNEEDPNLYFISRSDRVMCHIEGKGYHLFRKVGGRCGLAALGKDLPMD